jgi:hypothetical protein
MEDGRLKAALKRPQSRRFALTDVAGDLCDPVCRRGARGVTRTISVGCKMRR